MTEKEKFVVTRLCARILTDTDFYDTDQEIRDLIEWIIISNVAKKNNSEIRDLIIERKTLESEYRADNKEVIEHCKEICDKRQRLYDDQQEVKFKKDKIEQRLKDYISK